MATEVIHSKAPTRIDLAGGTLDIWPLYLFLKNPMTLNLGINLFAEAKIHSIFPKEKSGPEIRFLSEDQGVELECTWSELSQNLIQPPSSLTLHFQLLKFFYEKKLKLTEKAHDPGQIVFSTSAQSPAGAGLGGSSTLGIAMAGALDAWAGLGSSHDSLIEVVRDIEAQIIQVPAGLQDYYGAMYGGLQSLHWGIGKHSQTRWPQDRLKEIEKRLLLFYSGQSRNSGINNWTLFKNFIDQKKGIRDRFQKIASATQEIENAILSQDWEAVGLGISEEWAHRKTLSPGITTPEIDFVFSETSKIAPISGKVCGAGGGGCFFIYLSNPELLKDLQSKILKILENRKIQHLPFQGVEHGLEVHVQSS